MKKIMFIFLCLLSASLLACSKSKDSVDTNEIINQPETPSTPVPDELANGIWFSGTLSAISYFDRDGHKLGNDYEAGREYKFYNENGKGRIKFWQYLGTRGYSSCTTEIFTYKEGTVVFEGKKFTFYPVKGSFKTIKKDCTSGNGTTQRAATAEDLKPVVFLWEIRDVNGEPCLYTFEENDVDMQYPVFVYSLAQ